MSLPRLLIAFSMTGREFLRRRGMLALMVSVPIISFALVYLALPDTSANVDAIENGVHVRVETDQVALFGGISALIYGALLGGITGFYVLSSAIKSDRRLILAGYGPLELVAARCLVLLLLDAGITILLVVIMLFFFTPIQMPPYVLAMFWGTMIYGFYGALTATLVRNELGGLLVIVFLSNIDVGYLQIPSYSNVIEEWWARLLPGYFPVQLAIDAAFTAQPELLLASFWSVPHGLIVAGVMLAAYNRATHVHPFLPEQRRTLPKWAMALIGSLVVLVAGVGGVLGYQYLQSRPPVVEVEGRLDAPKALIVAPATGRLRSIEIEEGDQVEKDHVVAIVVDAATGTAFPIWAPMSGRVTSLERRAGENVIPGDIIAIIYDFRRLEAVLEVEEGAIGDVRVGQRVELVLGPQDFAASSRVAEIESAPLPAEPGVSERTRKVRKYGAKVPLFDDDPQLRIGLAVKGRIFVGEGTQ